MAKKWVEMGDEWYYGEGEFPFEPLVGSISKLKGVKMITYYCWCYTGFRSNRPTLKEAKRFVEIYSLPNEDREKRLKILNARRLR